MSLSSEAFEIDTPLDRKFDGIELRPINFVFRRKFKPLVIPRRYAL